MEGAMQDLPIGPNEADQDNEKSLMNVVPQNSERSQMARFFAPSCVALIGATDREGSVGRTVVKNLLSGSFKGKIYLVNSRRSELFGQRCYTTVADLPGPLDLAVIMTPAATVPEIVAECVSAKTKSIVVLSAGFKEKGPEGVALEQQIRAELNKGATRLIGPNCLGLMNPWHGLNATFAQDAVRPGNVAFARSRPRRQGRRNPACLVARGADGDAGRSAGASGRGGDARHAAKVSAAAASD